MKKIVVLLTLGFTVFFTFLDAQNQVVKDSLSVSELIGLNEKTNFKDYEVKFKKVIADSRCPKSVMCVRAGEAEVLVSIYKKGSYIEDKKIRIDASGYVMASNNLAFKTSELKIYGFSLIPYPDGVGDIDNKDYQLEIVFQPKG